jgi:uncharacterized protein YodC (DUF2158 family)
MTFQPGDVVVLKSGGQYLTVSSASDDGIDCIWIGEEGELFRDTLPLAVLKLADDDADDDEETDEAASGEDNEEGEAGPDEDARKIA